MESNIIHEYSLTPRDVAAILKVSERTLHNWRRQKTGPPFRKLGAVYRYSERSLSQWFNEKIEK